MTAVLRVMVVDDEPLARSRLRTLLGDCTQPVCQTVAEAGDAMQAMATLRTTACDVVLLDIHMPGADGLQLAREMRTVLPNVQVVFVTAYAEHAVNAFELEAVDYLTKPVRLERLQKAMAKVMANVLQKSELLTQYGKELAADSVQEVLIIQDRGRTERVPLSEVLYFKAELKYVTVRTASKSYILDGSLSELEERHGAAYLRIHRNALVAKRAMRALERHFERDPDADGGVEQEGWAVRLRGVDDALMVSRRQLSAVRAAIAAH